MEKEGCGFFLTTGKPQPNNEEKIGRKVLSRPDILVADNTKFTAFYKPIKMPFSETFSREVTHKEGGTFYINKALTGSTAC